MSYRLDAATERVFHSSALPNPAAGGLTIMGWFRLRFDREDFSTYWRTSSGGTIHTVATNIGGVTVNVFTVSGSLDNTYANVIDEWVHIAVTDSGGTVTQYVTPDGGSIVSQSGTVGTGTPDQVCIGGRDSGTATEWLNGTVAHVRVFADALAQAEVEAERDSATAVLTAWADWPLSTGTDLADASGNGRHLTAVGAGATTEEDPPLPEASNEGTLAATGLLPTASIAGAATSTGAVAATALLPTASVSGGVRNTGALDVAVPTPTATVTAVATAPGAVAGVVPVPTLAAAGEATTTGALAAVGLLPAVTLAALVATTGQLDAAAPVPAAVIATADVAGGSLIATAPAPLAGMQASAVTTGQWAASAPLPVLALTGSEVVSRGRITPTYRATAGITPTRRAVASITGR